ncbi:MAG TPA: efflux RND transporter periplasmic adaptor subunit [Verrucomicrobiae bacterium]|nr:efflux RND transporter periplasmic adaptor subunit [Verrucomicrobiae bacterium]
MAKPKNRRKIIIFSAIGLVLIVLMLVAVFKNRAPVITVQTEKVSRHSLTNLVVANGQIQPVVQVTISPEVSGEIIELPVKEGQQVKKGDLLVKINPDIYVAALNQAKAGYESELAAKASASANLEKADADYQRNLQLYQSKLLSESDFVGFKAARDVARAQLDSADDQVNVAKAQVDNADEQLARTTIVSPLDGTISVLNSEVGERVLGTVQNAGTVIMIISDLNEMEARVDIGEMDVVGIAPGQKARLEVDAFKDRKFAGVVTDVASSSKDSNLSATYNTGSSGSGQSQEATKFQVRIRFNEKEAFRPGMSVSAEIETSYRTNVLTVPLASVTTRPPPQKKMDPPKSAGTNSTASADTNAVASAAAARDSSKPVDIVFAVTGEHVQVVPVKIGICDDNYWEITDGLTNGEEIVSGGYRAISRDLQDDSKIKKGAVTAEVPKP